jgi:hypothetical protein
MTRDITLQMNMKKLAPELPIIFGRFGIIGPMYGRMARRRAFSLLIRWMYTMKVICEYVI